jgi:Nucleoside-diphosphate-sugar pyrophosphorylase involved in lipopolysaccharide biosynthesis/translation initiation factor 2B, gamma/epsilon subunits (eIF-2Bgamma/eIF-2Bepsilon)
MTGGRLLRVKNYVGNQSFMLTYGDGVADIDLRELVKVHRKSKKLATLTAVLHSDRFGVLDIEENSVKKFLEKPRGEGNRINAGFFVLEPEIFKSLTKGDATVWEREPLQTLAAKDQLGVYKHNGFWKCMDTLRDKLELDRMIGQGDAPWMSWR